MKTSFIVSLVLLIILALPHGGCSSGLDITPVRFDTTQKKFDAKPRIDISYVMKNGVTCTVYFDAPYGHRGFTELFVDTTRVTYCGVELRRGSSVTRYEISTVRRSTLLPGNATAKCRIGDLPDEAEYDIRGVVVIDARDTSYSSFTKVRTTAGPKNWVQKSRPSSPDSRCFSMVHKNRLFVWPMKSVYTSASHTWSTFTSSQQWMSQPQPAAVIDDIGYTCISSQLLMFSFTSPSQPIPGIDVPIRGLNNPFLFAVGKTLYLGGGSTYIGTGPEQNTAASSYVPATGTWTPISACPVRMGAILASHSVGSRGYIVAANADTTASDRFLTFEYDPVANTWTEKRPAPFNPMNTYVAFLPQTASANRLFVFRDATIWSYEPASDTWSVLSKEPLVMNSASSGPLLAYLGDSLYFGFTSDNVSSNLFWEFVE